MEQFRPPLHDTFLLRCTSNAAGHNVNPIQGIKAASLDRPHYDVAILGVEGQFVSVRLEDGTEEVWRVHDGSHIQLAWMENPNVVGTLMPTGLLKMPSGPWHSPCRPGQEWRDCVFEEIEID
jgi:hypothetical protein